MPRKRQIQMKFFVDKEERQAIEARREKLAFASQSEYLRTMALEGMIVNVDYVAIKNLTQELNRIGVNVNQITRRLNETGEVYAADVNEIKERLEEIWQLQRSILSSQP